MIKGRLLVLRTVLNRSMWYLTILSSHAHIEVVTVELRVCG
jgi:hypothetical protein